MVAATLIARATVRLRRPGSKIPPRPTAHPSPPARRSRNNMLFIGLCVLFVLVCLCLLRNCVCYLLSIQAQSARAESEGVLDRGLLAQGAPASTLTCTEVAGPARPRTACTDAYACRRACSAVVGIGLRPRIVHHLSGPKRDAHTQNLPQLIGRFPCPERRLRHLAGLSSARVTARPGGPARSAAGRRGSAWGSPPSTPSSPEPLKYATKTSKGI